MVSLTACSVCLVSNVRNTQCIGLAGMVCNPEFIIQGLLGLQLAWHQQAFLLGQGPLPPLSLKPAGGFWGLELHWDEVHNWSGCFLILSVFSLSQDLCVMCKVFMVYLPMKNCMENVTSLAHPHGPDTGYTGYTISIQKSLKVPSYFFSLPILIPMPKTINIWLFKYKIPMQYICRLNTWCSIKHLI